MNKLDDLLKRDEYDELPEVVRQYYSRREWQCMTDLQRASLMTDETEPEA